MAVLETIGTGLSFFSLLRGLLGWMSGWFGGGGSTSSDPKKPTNVLPENITGTTEAITAATGSSSDGNNEILIAARDITELGIESYTTPISVPDVTTSTLQVRKVEPTDVDGQLIVTYTENGKEGQTAIVNNYMKDGNSKFDVNEYRPNKWSGKNIISISLPDATGKAVVVEANYNTETGIFTPELTYKWGSVAAPKDYDDATLGESGTIPAIYVRDANDNVAALIAGGKNPKPGEFYNNRGQYTLNLGGGRTVTVTTRDIRNAADNSMPIGKKSPWDTQGTVEARSTLPTNSGTPKQRQFLDEEIQIATNPSTNTNNRASTLTNAITAFTDTGSTSASSINTDDTTPTTLVATG
ncbi:MAG: hypothetical protein ACK59C_02425 [Holosporales bacterium]